MVGDAVTAAEGGGRGGLTARWLIRGASHQRHEKTNNSVQHAHSFIHAHTSSEAMQCEEKVKGN